MTKTISSLDLVRARNELDELRAERNLRALGASRKWGKYFYDAERAWRAVRFIETYLVHSEGEEHAGKPFILQPWERKIVLKLFGWYRWSDGTRRYRKFLLHIPKKNGKSSLVAAIALYMTFSDREPAPHTACVSADKDTVLELFGMISNMVRANPRMKRRAEIRKGSIFIPRSLGAIRVLSKKPKHGPNWYVVLVDECHAIEKEETVDALVRGTVARTQPLVCLLSTSGFDKTHWYYREYEYAKSIAAGRIPRDDYLVVIFEADPEKWKEESEWFKANPNLGVTINVEKFREDFNEALAQPTKANAWKRLHLNIWTESEVQAVPMEKWDALNYHGESAKLEGAECFIGLDFSSFTDFTSKVLVFPPVPGRDYFDILCSYYFPRLNVKERAERLQGFDIQPWIDAGFITLHDGNTINYSAIRADILEDARRYNVRQIIMDPKETTDTQTILQDEYGFECVALHPSPGLMSFPTKQFLARVLEGKLNHRKNPVLRWNAANLVTTENYKGQLFPHKGRSKDKIDGVYALILALSGAMVTPPSSSVYNERGVVSV